MNTMENPKPISEPESQRNDLGKKIPSENPEIVFPKAFAVVDRLQEMVMPRPNAETIRFLDSMRDAAMGVPAGNIAQKNPDQNSGKFFLILDETLMQYFRRPRSKKRRIRRKWRARAENYRPHPLVFQQMLLMGAGAVANMEAYKKTVEYPVLKMHPETWAYVVAHNPGIEARAMIREEKPWKEWAPRVPFRLKRKTP
jgi:hypothetical protein